MAKQIEMELGRAGSAVPWHQAAQAFAAEVQKERRHRLMSTWSLAEQCGVSVRLVQDIEKGWPVEQSVIQAVCRNLLLEIPKLAGGPLHTFALLIRQRREQARLRQYQLAALSGIAAKTLKEVERATRWPRRDTCIALLSVTALQLQPQDIAEFVTNSAAAQAVAESMRESAEARLQACQDRIQSRRRTSQSVGSPEPVPNKTAKPKESRPRVLFTLRVYVDGSVTFVPSLKAPPD